MANGEEPRRATDELWHPRPAVSLSLALLASVQQRRHQQVPGITGLLEGTKSNREADDFFKVLYYNDHHSL